MFWAIINTLFGLISLWAWSGSTISHVNHSGLFQNDWAESSWVLSLVNSYNVGDRWWLGWENLPVFIDITTITTVSLFISKSDQVRISPVASPVILHHTVWRTWLFIAYSDWKMILVPVLTTSLIQFSWKGWENVLFELGIERVKLGSRPTVLCG